MRPERPLDSTRAGAIGQPSLRATAARRARTLGNWLEALRDRVIVRSQLSKRKLDAVFIRRQLDRKLADVGERLLNLVRQGRLAIPRDEDVAGLMWEARELKERLEAQYAEIAALESEPV